MALLIDDLQPLSPLATIEIPAALRGIEGAPHPQFAFDGSGTRLIVRSLVDTRHFPWLDDQWVDVCLFAGLVAIVLLVWITRRTIIRPRAVGHEHCRRCRYDITPLDGVRVSARCPECGCETTGRTVRGRRLRYWHFAIPLLCLSGTIVCALIVSAGISSMPSPARTSWPIASLKERFPWWPLWRVENKIQSGFGFRGAVYSLDASGHIQGDPWIVPLPWIRHFSSDGSRIVALDCSQANGFVQQAMILDCTARTTRTITFGTNADGFFQLASLAADGNSALVIQTILDRSISDRVTKIRRLDLKTGALTDIASALIPSAYSTSTKYETPAMSACVGKSPLLPWALVAHNTEISGPNALDANAPLRGSLLIVGTIDGEKRFEVPRVLGTSWNSNACSIEGDSTVVINEKMSVDVRTGQCKARRYPSFEVKTTADPSVAQLMEYEIMEIVQIPTPEATAQKIARTESARALLDLRPNSRTNTSWFPLGGATGAFNERSGLCAIGFAEAADKPPASFKVWRVKPK